MSYQILSDSSCDLPNSFLEQEQIRCVPFYVSFDQQHYQKENIEISNSEFYHTLKTTRIFPKTSLPSVQDYCNAFEEVLKTGKDVLCICITTKFSGSYQSAVNAKQILQESYPDASIVVLDSILATAGQGLLVLQAAKLQQAGFDLETTVQKLEQLKTTARIMFTVDTLEYLQKGGRIGKAASLAGSMLNLKPLIQLKEAELIPYANVRGRKKSLEKVIAMLAEHFTTINASYQDYLFCVVSSATEEETNRIKQMLEAEIQRPLTYPTFQIGVTIGTYTGPGAVGVCCIQKFDTL